MKIDSPQTLSNAATPAAALPLQSEQLAVLAFQEKHPDVFRAWLRLDAAQRLAALEDKYVLLSVCEQAGVHLGLLIAANAQAADDFGDEMLGHVLAVRARLASNAVSLTQLWFQSLDVLARALFDLHFLANARAVISLARETGCQKFPGVAQSIAITDTELSLSLGELASAETAALLYVDKPFLMPSRMNRPLVYARMLPVLAKTGHMAAYRETLWRGLTGYYGDATVRELFAARAKATYRGFWRTLVRADVGLGLRWIFVLHVMSRAAQGVWLARRLGVHALLRSMLWSQLYVQNYLADRRPYATGRTARFRGIWWRYGLRHRKGKILVARAMGGMGDLLMMVPGLVALKKKFPNKDIHFAVQKGFFPLLQGNPAFKTIDVHGDIDMREYERWYDLTDCPAARVEGLQFPRVRSNRIAIFAAAMGVKLGRLKASGVLPTYRVTEEEKLAAKAELAQLDTRALPVIGLQPFSADTYKNWPHIERLAREMSREAIVLVFHNEPFPGFDGPGIHKIVKPVRQSFALAAQCSLIVAPDSSFVHLGAALRIPTVAVFGPTSGRVFTKYYQPIVKVAAPKRSEFPCSPCWRNENRPCAISGDRESVCMNHISVRDIREAAERPPLAPWQRFKEDLQNFFW